MKPRLVRRRARHARAVALAALGVLPCLAHGFAESQFRCTAGEDGEWVCSDVEVETGPFRPVETAVIYSRASAQAAAGRGRPYGQTEEQEALTWVPRQALPAATQAGIPGFCAGAYQEYAWTDEELAADPRTARVDLAALRGEYQVEVGATLEGDVLITQGPRRLEAELASYDAIEEALALEGDVALREPGVLVRGEAARVDLASGEAELEDARFVLYDGSYRGEAVSIRQAEDTLVVEEGAFTRCEPGNESWKVAAGRIEIPEGETFAVATNARLEIYDVPVFWAPKLKVPVTDDRQTGWLFPSMGYSDQNGADIQTPFYFNIAPNYDATITPRFMSERGLLVESEFRQLTGNMENTIGGAWIDQDDNYNGELSFDEFEELITSGRRAPAIFEAEERWLFSFDHRGRWAPGLTSEASIVAVSDDDYLRDLGTDLSVNSQPELDRNASLRLRRGGFDVRLWAQDIRVLQENTLDTYERLPQFDLSWEDRFGDVPMVFGVDAQYAQFDRRDALATGRQDITGYRVHMVPRFTLPLEWSWGWIQAKGAWQYTRYHLDLPAALAASGDPLAPNPNEIDDNPTRILPTGSIDMGLRFERDMAVAGTQMLQTLEPRLYYLYIRDEDQNDLPLFDTADLTFGAEQLFRDNRFSGIDRIGDANQLTVALTSRAITRDDGTELLRFTGGRIFHFERRGVTLNGVPGREERDDKSGWVTDLVLRLGAGYDMKALWVWNNENGDLDQGLVRFRYRGGPRSLFNVAYRTRGDDINQLDASFSWPFRNDLALIGRYFYDFEIEDTLEAFGGLQYDDCCWRLRLVGRQFLRTTEGLQPTESETGVFFEVVMKGLAGFDTGLGSVLDDGIQGFGSQDPAQFDARRNRNVFGI